MTCKCGAKVDGESGYYRCHDRCGVRSIKKSTLEQAVIDEVFDSVFNADTLIELQAEIRALFEKRQPQQNHLVQQVKKEIKNVDRQMAELAGLLTEVRHRRPIIQRIDALEDERQDLDIRLSGLQETERPKMLSMQRSDLEEFATEWRTNLEGGTMEKRKAVFRQLIETATFDGEELEIIPNMATLTGTGVKVASPRKLVTNIRNQSLRVDKSHLGRKK